jgi:hypothetical protein
VTWVEIGQSYDGDGSLDGKTLAWDTGGGVVMRHHPTRSEPDTMVFLPGHAIVEGKLVAPQAIEAASQASLSGAGHELLERLREAIDEADNARAQVESIQREIAAKVSFFEAEFAESRRQHEVEVKRERSRSSNLRDELREEKKKHQELDKMYRAALAAAAHHGITVLDIEEHAGQLSPANGEGGELSLTVADGSRKKERRGWFGLGRK